MPNFNLGPLPSKNPENFSKFVPNKDSTFKKLEKMPVQQSVEGENNGECYKIKGPKTPLVLTHLVREFEARIDDLPNESESEEEPEEEPTAAPSTSGASKRQHEESEEPEEEQQEATTSAVTTRKKSRRQN
ncbi:unnamed protein product [Caenorhabditis sp. 36 PRJEB53466]|nr:unnamed protein product [Caenorhabditis sp. 36 PRJEB53466]